MYIIASSADNPKPFIPEIFCIEGHVYHDCMLTIMMIKHPQVHFILTVNLRLLKKSLHCHPLISKK